MSAQQMRDNWMRVIPYFCTYLKENNIYEIDDDFSLGEFVLYCIFIHAKIILQLH